MLFLERITKELKNLPGIVAHQKFYPSRFQTHKTSDLVRLSAVGVHFFEKDLERYLILIERSEYNGHHSKQIAFPGGKKEPSDSSLEETARRESIEEININMNYAELIGQITPVYIPISNFEVYPFLYWHKKMPTFDVNSNEVDEIILVKFKDLLSDENLSNFDVQITKSSSIKNVPCFKLENKIVWGATALILSEIKEILKRI